ncbi:MAG: TGS domain-containing protein [Desulfurococcales archaeon]|nr:TGS domain-containing protein [Desulfurococcales archaeon]
MPANLTAEAKAKLAKYSEARTIEEKIQALEEFISAVPKHKGTENLLLWARRRLAELKEEKEERRRKRAGGGGPRIFVERAGAGQVVLIGPPNSGKSSLLARLTNARPEIAPYPFTTQTPIPGMLQYEDIQFQLVDTPPLLLDQPDSPVNNRILGLARNANALLIVVGLDEPDPGYTLSRIMELLEDRGIVVTRRRGLVRILKSREINGVKIQGSGRMIDFTEDDLRRLLASYRIYNAIVEIEGDVSLDDVEKAIYQARMYKPAIIVLNKSDLPEARMKVSKIGELAGDDTPLVIASAKTGEGLNDIGGIIFKILGIIRVYTKQPNKEPDPNPLIVPKGTTVIEAARRIHKDLARNFKYAKIWGPSARYPGQRVGGEHILEDGDLIEIHTR